MNTCSLAVGYSPLTRTAFRGPLYTSDMKTSMPKQVAINAPNSEAAASAKGTCSSCLCNRTFTGNIPTFSPVMGSVVMCSCLKFFLLCSMRETPRTPQRTPRSTSWCFQYSVKTVHQRQLTIPYRAEKCPKNSQAAAPKAAGKTRKVK